jgi:hypothetical protein
LPFQSLKKNLKTNFKKILYHLKYGDNQRLPLIYLKTYSMKKPSYYELPHEYKDVPLTHYKSFPKLSQEILISLFSSVGVKYVPEVALYELKTKTPQKSFRDFCITFGEDENGLINSYFLNQVIERLKEMDTLRTNIPFDSREIYKALAYANLEKADRLIKQMKEIKNENKRITK